MDTIYNKTILLESKACLCLYCSRSYDTSKILNWCDNNDTAVCPYCWCDSVLPSFLHYDYTENEMKCFESIQFNHTRRMEKIYMHNCYNYVNIYNSYTSTFMLNYIVINIYKVINIYNTRDYIFTNLSVFIWKNCKCKIAPRHYM
jgi:hypothetical protein